MQQTSVDGLTAAAVGVPFADCWISPSAQREAQRVLASGWVTTGQEALAFESEFADRVGAQHAVSVSSCTAALELSLRSLQLAPGEPVLVSAVTFCGAVHAIVHAGLRPVLIDVDPRTGMPTDATTFAAANGCGGPAAMVVVHWAGDPADVPALAAAAGLPLDRIVEDAAHALGTYTGSVPVGTGPAVCFSFYATKNLPIGEGGMITTNDASRATWLRRARLHGMSADAWRRYLPGAQWRYDVHHDGLKANMTDLQAAIGRGQLSHLDDWQERRAEIAHRYDKAFEGVEGVVRPHRPPDGHGRHAWHLYPVRILGASGTTRDAVMASLAEQGIATSVHFTPIHQLDYFGTVAQTPPEGLPGANALAEQVMSLPIYPRLSDPQVDAVCDAVRKAVHVTVPRQFTRKAVTR